MGVIWICCYVVPRLRAFMATAAPPAGKLDIKDLPWEDRERVLRLLFARINNVRGGGGHKQ